MRRLHRQNGFTLIELLAVITIIGILAGLILGASKYAATKSKRSSSAAQIAAMEAALEDFKADNGFYPLSSPLGRQSPGGISGAIEIANSGSLYAALAGGPKTYCAFKPNQIRAVSATETNIVDPFGTPYNYYRPGSPGTSATATNGTTFDLWSYGPDKQNDTADDIANWKSNN